MRPLHILIPFPDFHGGGLEAVALRLAERWRASGHKVTILVGASDGPMRGRVPAGVDVRILEPERPRAAFSGLSLGRYLAEPARGLSPDLIFIPGNHHLLARPLRAALPGTPIVAKISNPLLMPPLSDPRLTWLARPALRIATSGIDWFVALSHGLAEEARFQLGHDRVSTILNPNVDDVPLTHFLFRPPLAASETLTIALVGRLEPQKDIPLALRTVQRVAARRPVHLHVYGDGGERARIEALIARLGLQETVTLAGYTDNVKGALASARLLLVTSRFEGVPGVVPEATALGLPVITTPCSHFVREFLKNESLGRVVEEGTPDALAAAILRQAAIAGPDAALAAQALEPLRQSTSAGHYLDLFERLLREREAL
ncbi:glycosyltransferase [Sphingobium lignivorans]|uniref:Glycosyltransferase involved in cell wall biosynthesis n=1 Tax=Sphingobium lignivorans TaxID=2735886 RepID=A0ABR6NFJ1_9SPHN|nr:glycosyltransferase [Sphingobium lignivorans]MBB5986057.1 glycosyltransferase involved in cell wall biosynthesis [Sphingobium lignivorans]